MGMLVRDAGFTTIEILEATVLSGIALAGLCALLVTTIHGNVQARDITAAATLAETKVEELRATDFGLLASGSDTVADGGAEWTRSWKVTSGPTAGTKKVVVLIDGVRGQPAPLRLETILAD
jgi:Tfp pilus assembly protein PilV